MPGKNLLNLTDFDSDFGEGNVGLDDVVGSKISLSSLADPFPTSDRPVNVFYIYIYIYI